MNQIIQLIRADLKAQADPKTKEVEQRFFKEPLRLYGLRTPAVQKIALKFWPQIKDLPKKEIFGLCEELFGSGFMEEASVVAVWLPEMVDRFERADLAVFRRWIECCVDNWAKCDGFCNHTVGDFMMKFPDCVGELLVWAKSKNRWLRRAAAVTLIIPERRGMFLAEAFEISDILLTDSDDLVQKGYGWMLKAASEKHPAEVLDYVLKNKAVMPRTALRYAIEKLPKEQKALAMKNP